MIALQRAGLDHNGAFGWRVEERLERRHDVFGAELDMHRASAAEERDRVRFIGEAQRIGSEFVAIKFDKLERIRGIIDKRAQKFAGALAH